MKKLLLSLALVATGMGLANADTTVEFLSSNKQLTYTGTVSGNNIQPLKTLTNAGVTITFTKDNGDDKGGSQPAWYGFAEGQPFNSFRCYANNTMVFTVPSGQNVKKIDITFADNFGAQQYANLIPSTGTITPQVDKNNNKPTDGMTITWEGNASTVTLAVPNDKALTVNGKLPQCQAVKILVTYGTGSGPTAPGAPTIEGTTPFYGASNTVTMTAETGAEIYYTMTAGTTAPADPTTSSLKYDGEIVINGTTSFKAIAVKNGLSSSVTSKTFTKGEAISVSSIADFLEQNNDEVCTFTNPVTVVGLYSNAKKTVKYLYVQDATGGLQIFDGTGKLDRPYKMGQTIKGFTVKLSAHNGTPQGNASDFVATFQANADGNEQKIFPKHINATEADIKANLNRYVVLTNTFTKTGKNYFMESVQIYDSFALNVLSDALVGQRKDAAGFAVMYNTTPELNVIEVGEPGTLEVSGIEAGEADIYGTYGNIVAPEGAQIYNLSGMKVANGNLPAGIYLVRNNGKTTKVVVK